MNDSRPRIDPEELLAQSPWMRRLAARVAGDDVADDVAQEALVVALAGAPLERGRAGLRAWLARVTQNLARKASRDRMRRAADTLDERALAAERSRGDYERVEAYRKLTDAVLELDEPYRDVIVARYFDDLPTAEIARQRNVSTALVRQRLSRGVRMLRARLGTDPRAGAAPWALAWLPSASREAISGLWALGGGIMAWKTVAGVSVALAALVLSAVLWMPDEPRPERAVLPEPSGTRSAERLEGPEESPQLVLEAAARSEREVVAEPEAASPAAVVFEGRLRDSEGNAVSSGWVGRVEAPVSGQVDVREPAALAELLDPALRVPVDEDGGFRLEGPVGASELHVVARADGFLDTLKRLEVGAPATLRLARRPRVIAHGRFADGRSAEPPGSARLWVRPEEGQDEYREAALGSDGAFRFEDLPVGRLGRVHVLVRGFPERSREPDIALEPDETTTLEFTIHEGATVEGVVVDEQNGDPLPGARVWTENHSWEADSLHPHAITDASGRFRLEGVGSMSHATGEGDPVEVFFLHADADGYSSSKYRAYASAWREDRHYEFEIAVASTACSLEGLVRLPDGVTPAAGAYVYAASEEGDDEFEVTDEDGRFRFDELHAGELQLFVRAGSDTPEERWTFVRRRAVVAVGDPQTIELTLEQPACGASISGALVDEGGGPIEAREVHLGWVVKLGWISFEMNGMTVTTDESGRFRFDDLPDGEYSVKPRGAGICSTPISTRVDVRAQADESDVAFVVTDCITFAGTVEGAAQALEQLEVAVYDEDGAILQRASVDPNGVFESSPLARGLYTLRVVRGEQTLLETLAGPEPRSDLELHVPE